MYKIRLRDDAQTWEHAPLHTRGGQCTEGFHRYCLGEYGGTTGAVQGFLGEWSRDLTEITRQLDWDQLGKESSPLIRRIKGERIDETAWKGLLTCVMSNALKLERIEVRTNQGKEEIWSKNNWTSMLKNSTGRDWGKTDVGQKMLMALTCLITVLVGTPRPQETEAKIERSPCSPVWEKVALKLGGHSQPSEPKEIKNIEEFMEGINYGDLREEDQKRRLGFVLSIYHGINKCCQSETPYELNGIIRQNGWDLKKIGQCHLDGQELKCDGTGAQGGGQGLNIWTKGGKTLVEGLPRKKPAKLQLVEPETGEHLRVGNPTTEVSQREKNFVTETAKRMSEAHSLASSSPVFLRGEASGEQLRDETLDRRQPTTSLPKEKKLNTSPADREPLSKETLPDQVGVKKGNSQTGPDPPGSQGLHKGKRPHGHSKPNPPSMTTLQSTTDRSDLNEGSAAVDAVTAEDQYNQFPTEPNISIQGLMGGVVGGILALAINPRLRRKSARSSGIEEQETFIHLSLLFTRIEPKVQPRSE
ncbi:hypothetical protein C922_04449 [Plasmodium inui San Antonio 1]|uniref:Uncharacterized protein n=1 Tax=Plasmodium inui San Antonio 1 TaxID=1237626 RepID=W7A1E4_9APIC|nr:hypothetical protein C922_04449 [Plasmodium inui San Antonio 1]EUD65163.1 hypothetical protein C922_04449 [Plasmodium inui San Antonio 1]